MFSTRNRKAILIAAIVAAEFLRTYYFSVVLGHQVTFADLFYVPIVLAALWWKRKGIPIAVGLAIVLIASHVLLHLPTLVDDYSRGAMFIVVAVAVALSSEQLEKRRKELREAEQVYSNMMENSNDFIWTLDTEGNFSFINKCAANATGYGPDKLLGKSFATLVYPPEDLPRVQKTFEDALHGSIASHELGVVTAGGGIAHLSVNTTPLYHEGVVIGTVSFGQDITARKRLEDDLHAERNKLRSVLDSMNTYVTIRDNAYNITYQNAHVTGLFGLHLGEKCYHAFHGRDAVCAGCPVELSFADGRVHTAERMTTTSSGEPSYWDNSAYPIMDATGTVAACVEVVTDITERVASQATSRRMEAELASLSKRLIAAQEEERRNIARELHDQTAQSLALVKMQLDAVTKHPAAETDARLAQTQTVVQEVIESVREMSLNLRPSILDDLGLLSALLWYFERYEARTGVSVRFTHDGVTDAKLQSSADVRTAAFRIVQEALANVARHAGVAKVEVGIEVEGETLRIHAADEGTGFDPASVPSTCIGLGSMRERALLLGGDMTVSSRPGGGTRLTVSLPLVAGVQPSTNASTAPADGGLD